MTVNKLDPLFDTRITRGVRAPKNIQDRKRYHEIIEGFGALEVLEVIARGTSLAEIAAELEVPIIVLNSWIQDNIPAVDLKEARRLSAETNMARAGYLLNAPVMDNLELKQATELAKHYRQLAERGNPDHYGPPRPAEPGLGEKFSLVMHLGGDDPSKTIDLEATTVPTQAKSDEIQGLPALEDVLSMTTADMIKEDDYE